MARTRFLLLLCAFLTALAHGGAAAQDAALTGIRGTLYESPSHGWILVAPAPDWVFTEAQSADGVDTVNLVSMNGQGAEETFVSLLDDGRGPEGCAHDIIDTVAQTFSSAPLEGWADSEIESFPIEPAGFAARVRIPDLNAPNLDWLAYVECRAGRGGVLLGSLLVRSAIDLEFQVDLPLLSSLMPGEGHTGRPRDDSEMPLQGVLRFLARGFPVNAGGTEAQPFSCIEQEAFTPPDDAPPPDRGWFACDGQIANVDVVPAMIDLADLALGCESVPEGEVAPPECPAAPIPPSHAEILWSPGEVNGSVLTLQPGESAEVVLWYALPEGYPPPDILYLEPDRRVLAGATYFSEGGGSRPRVRISR